MRATSDQPDRFIPIVTGPATSAYTVSFREGDVWHGLRLRPDRAVAVWGARIGQVEDHVAKGAAAEVVVPALTEQNHRTDPIGRLKLSVPENNRSHGSAMLSKALDVIHFVGGRIRVEKLARFLGISSRHLNRLFQRNVGLRVKSYIQLAQFHRTLRLIHAGGISLSQAAFEGGYADHAHMTRAFRRFGGFAPTSIPENLALPAVFHK